MHTKNKTNHFVLLRSKRIPFAATGKLALISAKTAIHIVAVLKKAITKNTDLMSKAKVMFCYKTECVRVDNCTVSAARFRVSFMMATSAASIAVSVPAPPRH